MLETPPPDHHFPMPQERLDRFEAALAQRGERLDGARVIGDGYGSAAYLLTDGFTVARVPKFEDAVSDLEFGLSVLPVLESAALPVETPRDARALRDRHGLVAALHRLVPGESLKSRIEELRASGDWWELARDVGRFLTALRSIPLERFEGLGADRSDQLLDRRVVPARPALGERGSAWLDARLARLNELARPPAVADVFIHGDFWPSNVLVDESGAFSGLIDFGLAAIADPAWDFRSFEHLLSPEFLAGVVDAYDRPLDAHALERARILFELDEVGNLSYELTVLGQRGESFDAVQRMIEKWDGNA